MPFPKSVSIGSAAKNRKGKVRRSQEWLKKSHNA